MDSSAKNEEKSKGDEPLFVLASGSPRRLELLKNRLRKFTVLPGNIDETQFSGEPPEIYARRVSRWKAKAVFDRPEMRARDVWVLAADTIVVLDGDVMGKPADAEDARSMLGRLQARTHHVITGVCLVNRKREVFQDDAVQSSVRMRKIAPEEINDYIRSGEPFDKAGGYAIQGLAGKFVEEVRGSYTNVVGLPMEHVDKIFQRLGIS